MNCYDDNCKYYHTLYNGSDECMLKPNFEIPTDDNFSCPDYVEAKNCLTCRYASTITYETGTIDCIEYRCGVHGKTSWTDKVIYNDSEPMICHHYDIPECPNGNWERE